MIALSTLLLSALMNAAAGTPSRLGVENCDAGEAYAFTAAECQIELANEGDVPIKVSGFASEKEGDAVEPQTAVVAPHAHAYLRARINAGNASGGSPHVFRFHTDEKGNESRTASAFVFVLNALDQPRPTIDFDVVDSASEPEDKQAFISSHDIADLRLTEIIEKPAWLDAHISTDGHKVVARVRKDAYWGIHADYIKLKTNSRQQPQVWVTAKADVHGEVTPSSNPFDLGLMRFGNAHEYRVVLTQKSGKAFKLGNIELKDVSGNAQVEACQPAADSCKMLVLDISDKQSGTIQGHVWIDLPEYKQKLHLALFGLLVAQDVKVKTLDPEKLAKEGGAAQSSSNQDAKIDLQKSVKQAIEKAEEAPPPPGNGPLLKWTIANGGAIRGFQIFRSVSEDGQFLLLNPQTVRSTAQNADAQTYQYRDNSAESGKTYWYYIGILYNDGHKQQLTGPQKVVAK